MSFTDFWLSKNIPNNSRVGVDPTLFILSRWNRVNGHLISYGHNLVPIATSLTSILWTDRPPRPCHKVFPLELKYTGKTIAEKLDNIIRDMKDRNCTTLVISTLDDIAWTLNLRGSDIAYNPVFFAYLVIKKNNVAVFLRNEQFSFEVQEHITTQLAGKFSHKIYSYEEIDNYLKECGNERVWFADNINYHLNSLVPQQNQHIEISPTTLMKAVKNPVEVQGMINAHIKDGAALCCYFAWLEENVPKGEVTEISGATKLEEFRKMQKDFVGMLCSAFLDQSFRS